MMDDKLINHFQKKYDIDDSSVRKALQLQQEYGGNIGGILLNLGFISEGQLVEILREYYGLKQFSDVKEKLNFDQILSKIPIGLLKFLIQQGSIPLYFENGTLWILSADPLSDIGKEVVLHHKLAAQVRYVIGLEREVREITAQYLEKTGDNITNGEEPGSGERERIKEMAFEAPVIKFVNSTIARAVELEASDIHFEPLRESFRIRYRIDGILHVVDAIVERLYLAVISRIKLLARLDIAERRLPQDGKFTLRISGRGVDIRVSSFPVAKGEVVVLRLLYKESLALDIGALGIEDDFKEIFLRLIHRPYGLILVTGPTGSGKTTTLYAALSRLNLPSKKIITVEDPVEYQLDGINQIQVKPEINLTFANALRSIVRQDPDVIMIGEIRDAETAEIAVHAALTGHLVLSTLHTNDSTGAFFRLIEMGVEDYLLNAALLGVVAQRLVRKVCANCAVKVPVPGEFLCDRQMMETLESFYSGSVPRITRVGKGCKECSGTGFRRRIAIFELFEHDETLKEIFIKEKSRGRVMAYLRAKGFRTLREDGMIKALKGVTTPQEVYGVI